MKTYERLRAAYPTFIYHSYSLTYDGQTARLSWHFEVPGLTEYRPSLSIPLPPALVRNDPLSPVARRLAFAIGMVELVSYWKCTCSPRVIIHAGSLDQTEILWWKRLYFGGLGEFFYRNGITTDETSFMTVECCRDDDDDLREAREESSRWQDAGLNIIPVGGGKDSVVTLERSRSLFSKNLVFGINPTPAARDCMAIAGYPDDRRLLLSRSLDKNMLDLNRRGFLNGHTPFSAIVAFNAAFCAYVTGASSIVLSNEASANESSVPGTDINHQFSKTSEFEEAFATYLQASVGLPIRYFSLLRPFNEICIARDFASYPQYFEAFRSCNIGSKTNVWCGHCAKCLFIALMIAPFVAKETLDHIFGRDILDDPDLGGVLDELDGAVPVKAFECVGTVSEVRYALALLLRRYHPLAGAGEEGQGKDPTGSASNTTAKEIKALLQKALPALLERYLKQAREGRFPSVQLDDHGFPFNAPGEPDPLTTIHPRNGVPAEWLPLVRDMARPRVVDYLRGKSVLILGFGREGRTSYDWLRLHAPELALSRLGIADRGEISLPGVQIAQRSDQPVPPAAHTASPAIPPAATALPPVELFTGDDYLSAISHFDLVLKSPGISFRDFTDHWLAPGVLAAFPHTEITGQVDLFLRFGPTRRVVGVTGTKGKSTTTSLTAQIFLNAGRRVHLLGNIGIPVFGAMDQVMPGDVVTLELSSHQLQFTQASPQVAIITNLYEEHLDHYRAYDEYVESKLNIIRNQGPADVFILNTDHPEVVERALPLVKGRVFAVAQRADGRDPSALAAEGDAHLAAMGRQPARWFFYDGARTTMLSNCGAGRSRSLVELCPNDQNRALRGIHNACDTAFASAAALALGLDPQDIAPGVAAFPGIPHRLEYIGTYKGIEFYNDSIATIPQSATLAIQTLEKVKTLVAGGMDRGIDYTVFADFLAGCGIQTLICLPDTGKQLASLLKTRAPGLHIVLCEEMEDAVREAFASTPEGTICLLSPAASSYNRYKNFEERGNDFRHWVEVLGGHRED